METSLPSSEIALKNPTKRDVNAAENRAKIEEAEARIAAAQAEQKKKEIETKINELNLHKLQYDANVRKASTMTAEEVGEEYKKFSEKRRESEEKSKLDKQASQTSKKIEAVSQGVNKIAGKIESRRKLGSIEEETRDSFQRILEALPPNSDVVRRRFVLLQKNMMLVAKAEDMSMDALNFACEVMFPMLGAFVSEDKAKIFDRIARLPVPAVRKLVSASVRGIGNVNTKIIATKPGQQVISNQNRNPFTRLDTEIHQKLHDIVYGAYNTFIRIPEEVDEVEVLPDLDNSNMPPLENIESAASALTKETVDTDNTAASNTDTKETVYVATARPVMESQTDTKDVVANLDK